MYGGSEWTGLLVAMVIGLIVMVVGTGAVAGLLVVLPFALWFHDLGLLAIGSAIGAVLAVIIAGLHCIPR